MISYFSNSNLKKKKKKKKKNKKKKKKKKKEKKKEVEKEKEKITQTIWPPTKKPGSGRTTLEGLRGSTTRHSGGVASPPGSMGGRPPTISTFVLKFLFF